MFLIKQNESTAARRRVPVVFVDDTDGKTPEPGVTLSAGDMKVSKNGGAETNHAGAVTEQAGGDYYYEFDSTEVDTLGFLRARIVKSGVRTFRIAAQVVAFDPYATSAVQGGDAYADTQTILSRLGTPSNLGGGANVAANLADIESQTDDIGVAGAGLSAIPGASDPWSTPLPGPYGAGTAGKIIGDNINATVSSRSSHSAADAAAAVWAAGARTLTSFGTLASDVWSAVTRTLTSGANIALAKGTGVTGFNDLDAAGVRGAVGLGAANLDAQLTGINDKTTNLPSDPADQSLIIAATNSIAAAIAALNNLSEAQVLAKMNEAITAPVADSVPALGARPSIAQAAYISTQFNLRRGVSGTVMTVYKPDGSALLTMTLDDATNPSAITRAT
jgi:hypothetical protein